MKKQEIKKSIGKAIERIPSEEYKCYLACFFGENSIIYDTQGTPGATEILTLLRRVTETSINNHPAIVKLFPEVVALKIAMDKKFQPIEETIPVQP